MKNKKYGNLSVAALLTVALLLTGCSGERKDAPEDQSGAGSDSVINDASGMNESDEMDASEGDAAGGPDSSGDVDPEYILSQLQMYADEIPGIDLDQKLTVPVKIPAGEMADIAAYKYVPDTSGVYDLDLSIPEGCGGKTYLAIIDQNAHILNKFPDTSAGMIIGQQYFLVFYTEADNPDKEVSFDLTVSMKLTDTVIEYQELELGVNHFTIEAECEKLAAFSPEESGYFRFDVHCLDAEHGTAAIDAVLKEDDENIYGGLDLFYMDKGTVYYIVYGAYETGMEEADVCIDIEPFDLIELGEQKTIKTEKNVILMYTAKTTDEILVYSVSDGDPEAAVYNQEFTVVAENSDADGVLSDNTHDFAMLVLAEKGKDYYIVVDHVEGHACEIHLENADSVIPDGDF